MSLKGIQTRLNRSSSYVRPLRCSVIAGLQVYLFRPALLAARPR